MPHVSIDANVQLFDLQQRSGGTRALQRAMDGCGVRKALLMGMPVYKKWAKEEADRPSELRDDHSLCYYYSYTDQMVADAWLALPPDQRSRFAPIMGGVNPTDLNAADHLERLWEKYPGKRISFSTRDSSSSISTDRSLEGCWEDSVSIRSHGQHGRVE